MSLKVQAPDGVKVYTVSGGKNIPAWLSDKKKKALRKDEEYRRRIELIQDFEFPAGCQRIKVTPDGQYIFASGYHPPQMRCYDVSQLSMKFDRHLDSEIVDFQILSEDYSKAVFLCADRSLSFHARFGAYYKTRVPKFGRDLAYCPFSAELLVAASAPEVYRLNLEEGRFLTPLSSRSPAVNACGISPAHGLLACAGEDGALECFDLRQRDSLGWLDAAGAAGGRGQALTALRFDASGMHVAVGTSGGLVALFDLRSQRPMQVKDHMYDSRIVDIKFHSTINGGGGGQHVISSDRHIIKIWEADSGEGLTNIEPQDADINDVCVWPRSGLIVVGCDSARMRAYFVPSLGPAPPWCSFLESLTEELEESANPTVYDDYRFVTRADLDKLGLTHLVGTPLLRAYMHGFFVDNRLYSKAKAIADPFAYDAYRAKRVAAKVEEERRSRISLVKKLPRVNAQAAARIIAEQAGVDLEEGGKKKRKAGDTALPSLLDDNRFKAMFEDPEFAIDEMSSEWKLLHPNTDPAKERKLLAEHFESLEGDDGEGSSDGEGYSDDEVEAAAARRGARGHRDKRLRGEPGGGGEPGASGREPRMYAAKDEAAATAFMQRRSYTEEKAAPLGQRAAAAAAAGANATARSGGSKEITFKPRYAPDGPGGPKAVAAAVAAAAGAAVVVAAAAGAAAAAGGEVALVGAAAAVGAAEDEAAAAAVGVAGDER
ncbi:Nucleolar 10 [Micractinium conductrix]|uniref:Nucleolar 10 n=1 Tax=Micractinium conductrix TaxID=554055 RepID=A0A2P6VEJ1_9CHLO|nr:Nucleolar 10 [Micractinium conductrix]|eukprot:PSC72487.1 Nucleolar 10 [Micractinium conductrix]